MMNDAINGSFELLSGCFAWLNVIKIRQQRKIAGVDWRVTGFFTLWGVWNLWYYPSLHQWISFVGGVSIVVSNAVWLYHVFKYRDSL